jgi:hypothetical protein
MSFKDKLDFVSQMGDRGMLMIDEAREVFNLAPLPDGQGQKVLARGEYYNPNEKQEETGNADK